MGVKITKLRQGLGEFSYDGTFDSPIVWEAATAGGILEMRVFLSMDDPFTEYCVNGRMYATDSYGEDESGWYEFAQDDGGGPGTYSSSAPFEIPLGAEVPMYIRVTVPPNLEEEPKEDVSITLSYIGYGAES